MWLSWPGSNQKSVMPATPRNAMSINWLHFFTGSLNLSRGDDAEPTLSATALTQRCMTLAAQLGDALEHDTGELSFVSEISDTQAALTLGGRASEVIERNAGPKHRVVQLCSLSEEVFAWVGFRERWKRIGNERHFRFLDGGFTIHVGRQGEIFKPQIMRSEWVGRRGNDYSRSYRTSSLADRYTGDSSWRRARGSGAFRCWFIAHTHCGVQSGPGRSTDRRRLAQSSDRAHASSECCTVVATTKSARRKLS